MYSDIDIKKIKKRVLFFLFLALALVSCKVHQEKPIQFREIKTPNNSISPLISNWNNLNEEGLKIKTDSFFRQHTDFPLVELDPLYEDYSYITFIYVESSENKRVEFDIFGNYNDRSLGDKILMRLKNTNIYYRTYYMPNDICFSYRFMVTDTVSKTTKTTTDPLNKNRIPTGELKEYSWSVLDLRGDEVDWYKKRYQEVNSQLLELLFDSKILKNSRRIYVYLPEGYDKSRSQGYQTLYFFDSFIYLNRIEVPNVLDNLIREGFLEPTICVFIDNPSKALRDLELALDFPFKEFVVNELVPYVRSNWKVTHDPKKTIIGGMSYGGLAAGFCAFYHDSLFGNVLSQSGSFWRDTVIEDPSTNWHRTDWLITKFQVSPKRNIRFYLDWGLQEPIILNSNRKFTRILDGLDYEYKISEFDGWHDWSNSRKSFPVGLLYLANQK